MISVTGLLFIHVFLCFLIHALRTVDLTLPFCDIWRLMEHADPEGASEELSDMIHVNQSLFILAYDPLLV